MDLSDLTYEGGNYRPEIYKSGVCVAKEGATESLVQATCESVILSLYSFKKLVIDKLPSLL